MKTESLVVQNVHYMPEKLEPGILYVSKDFETAIHLCACGCGSKVVTPIDKEGWTLEDTNEGPTLHPSILQRSCKSHYLLVKGKIVWV